MRLMRFERSATARSQCAGDVATTSTDSLTDSEGFPHLTAAARSARVRSPDGSWQHDEPLGSGLARARARVVVVVVAAAATDHDHDHDAHDAHDAAACSNYYR